ncbi:outer membrane beta-barrel protein [Pedobacter deserti]|uniref:outer membrane beta-barrel protein n=1 Tax=Pedobacter deserti TaxID=2817382 RepID=UPI00210C5B72|nr:outer membrane beta-barrel protein [Pedobacter sp. SYSU D00382]
MTSTRAISTKSLFALWALMTLCLSATAQSNYYKLGIGGGYGFTQAFTDLLDQDFSKAIYGQAEFFFSPFVSIGAEIQQGKIKSGNSSDDPLARAFVNDYTLTGLNAKLYLGAVTDHRSGRLLDALKWLYLGSGAAIIRNKISHKNELEDDIYLGKSKSRELVLPLNLGFSYYFNDRAGMPRLGINANIQVNFSLGEGLDGYDRSNVTFKEDVPDRYHFYSAGLRYLFGPTGLSKRSLN